MITSGIIRNVSKEFMFKKSIMRFSASKNKGMKQYAKKQRKIVVGKSKEPK